MKVNKKTALINGKEMKYTFFENNNDTVCFMFPGMGYTHDMPLFYYPTFLMLENMVDVVHIHYSYKQEIFELPLEQITEMLVQDVILFVNEVLRNKQYKETIFLGKSLGTIPIVNGFMKSELYKNSKMVLFTPLLGYNPLFETLLSNTYSTLLVIGTNDPHYIPDKIETLSSKENIKLKVIDNANHSLNIEPLNTSASIRILNEVVDTLNHFLRERQC